LLKDATFDPLASLAPVGMAYSITHAVAVPARSLYKTLADLLADARARPDKVRFASAGVGTPGHLAGEMLAIKAKTVLVHIPYKGGGQVLTDLLGGQLECHVGALPTVMTHVQAGTLRLLAVTSSKRVQSVPHVPTVAEAAGVSEFDFPLWGGVFAPARTPKEVITLLNTELVQAFNRPEVQARVAALHSDIVKYTPDQFAQFLVADSDRYRTVIKESGVAPR
jgi:tripartite-type tricarboxylate transporter receptor subunit TctC